MGTKERRERVISQPPKKLSGVRYIMRSALLFGWSKTTTAVFLLSRLFARTGFAKISDFFLSQFNGSLIASFDKNYAVYVGDMKYYNVCGAKLPSFESKEDMLRFIRWVYYDTFLVRCLYNDDYSSRITKFLDGHLSEGAYGYTDGGFDVTVKAGDVVIDAGSWIGDFAAYAASKGATVYAFEPTNDIYNILQKTARLNDDKIIPVKKGLGSSIGEAHLSIDTTNSEANSIVIDRSSLTETIQITTLDQFVKDNNIGKIDFIKADIEGAEREMLKGAKWVLANHAPKLALCTYHLPDDPQIMKQLILDANPNYTIIQQTSKFYASVV